MIFRDCQGDIVHFQFHFNGQIVILNLLRPGGLLYPDLSYRLSPMVRNKVRNLYILKRGEG